MTIAKKLFVAAVLALMLYVIVAGLVKIIAPYCC
jgi:hypothetical protein